MRDSALILATMLGLDAVDDPQTLWRPRSRSRRSRWWRAGRRPLAGLTIAFRRRNWMNVNGTVQMGVKPQATYGAGHLATFTRLSASSRSSRREGDRVPGHWTSPDPQQNRTSRLRPCWPIDRLAGEPSAAW